MREAYDEKRTVFRLGNELARGGQGAISYLEGVQTHCIKVYHKAPDSQQVSKLKLLRSKSSRLEKIAALPVSVAFADEELSHPVGIFLPFVKGREIYELYGTRARIQHFPKANFKFLVHVAYNLASAFDELHQHGIIIGDINEQNIKVLPDATICLIDCDSFQISDGNSFYTCDVGTPIWTPPELQGHDLTNLRRVPNHDLFGLAQLVFLLLFAGRHPFSGVPRTARQPLLEEAIRDYMFAFAPPDLGLALSPPPACPPMQALPQLIQQNFGKAFLKGSERPLSRPSAKDWQLALSNLLRELVACGRHQGHVFWKGAKMCPWCFVVKEAGIDLFPAPLGGGAPTSLVEDEQITRLAGLRPYPFALQLPQICSDLTPEPLPPQPSGFWSFLLKMLSVRSWKQNWLNSFLKKNANVVSMAEKLLNNCFTEQQLAINSYNQEFQQLRALIHPLVQKLSNKIPIRRDIEATIAKERRELELRDFLEGFQLRHATIRDIGPGRKATLQSYGVETAADISYRTIAKVPGFGPSLTQNLINWCAGCEARFVFDASQPLPPQLKAEIEKRFQDQLRRFRDELAQLEIKLNETQRKCNERLRLSQAQAVQYSRQRDQATANIALLNSALHS